MAKIFRLIRNLVLTIFSIGIIFIIMSSFLGSTLYSYKEACDILHMDRTCDAADLAVFRNALGKCRNDVGYDHHADANGDGCVDQADGRVLLNLLGDLNGDGNVDCQDSAMMQASFGKKDGEAGFNFHADLNQDAIVDARDIDEVASNKIVDSEIRAFVTRTFQDGADCP